MDRTWWWAAVALAVTACGGGQWREVDARLNDAAQSVRAEGYAPLSGPYNDFGSFQGSTVYRWRVQLDSGVSYAVGAACSAWCEALVMTVRGPDSSIVARDTAEHQTRPLVRLVAPVSGTYTALLEGRCAGADECRWVSQVYARGVPGLRPGFAGGER